MNNIPETGGNGKLTVRFTRNLNAVKITGMGIEETKRLQTVFRFRNGRLVRAKQFESGSENSIKP